MTFIEDALGLTPGARILDVPCGSGRHALALAERGDRVTGVDLSAEAIDFAERAARDAGRDVTFVRAEMRDIPRGSEFDAAICMGNSFGYLDHAGTRAFVEALATAVRAGGGLVIDFSSTAESVLPSFTGEPRTMEAGGIRVTAGGEYDIRRSCIASTYRFVRGTEDVTLTALHHVYTVAAVCAFLTDAGFTEIGLSADTDRTPFTLGCGRLLLSCRRR